eukprot:scaffold304017_cov31-Tisochrysis_lutea.AAC.1
MPIASACAAREQKVVSGYVVARNPHYEPDPRKRTWAVPPEPKNKERGGEAKSLEEGTKKAC